MTKHINTTKVT